MYTEVLIPNKNTINYPVINDVQNMAFDKKRNTGDSKSLYINMHLYSEEHTNTVINADNVICITKPLHQTQLLKSICDIADNKDLNITAQIEHVSQTSPFHKIKKTLEHDNFVYIGDFKYLRLTPFKRSHQFSIPIPVSLSEEINKVLEILYFIKNNHLNYPSSVLLHLNEEKGRDVSLLIEALEKLSNKIFNKNAIQFSDHICLNYQDVFQLYSLANHFNVIYRNEEILKQSNLNSNFYKFDKLMKIGKNFFNN